MDEFHARRTETNPFAFFIALSVPTFLIFNTLFASRRVYDDDSKTFQKISRLDLQTKDNGVL